MRGPDNGRDSNRDYQRESYPLGSDENWVKRVGIDSDLDLEDGPLKTNAFGKAEQTIAYHRWEASSNLSNNDSEFYGNWEGYADVPHKRPDTESNPQYQGTVDEDFSRSDTDWWEYLNTDETIDDCQAWASIMENTYLVLNISIHHTHMFRFRTQFF